MPRIAIVLTEGYADWECAFLNGVGRGFYGLDTVNAMPGGRTVTSQGGLRTVATARLEDVGPDRYDGLVICGGTIWETEQAPDAGRIAAAFVRAGKPVGGICGGTLALARAGLLDDRAHTSNGLDFLSTNVPDYRGAKGYVDTVGAVSDRNVITAPGTAPVHFTGEIFRAAGLDDGAVAGFLGMLAAEHRETRDPMPAARAG
ncbi:MAG: DJ-1/PfpI family protein [Inquilinaceae bacterium]